MKTKKTAVDWLIQELVELDKQLDPTILKINPIKIYQQAKLIEKNQIEEAYDNGGDHYTETGKAIWGKDYYNETYGK